MNTAKNEKQALKLAKEGLEKGQTKELLGYLKKQNDWGSIRRIDEGHYFSKQLEKLYPSDIVELYWDEEWQKRYKNFREKHKRKRILMGLLEKQKEL